MRGRFTVMMRIYAGRRVLKMDCGACGMPMWRCGCDFGV
jgi:hypothetical protein